MSREESPRDADRIRVLFDRAIELPEDERAAYLDEACGQDEDLRGLLYSLVDAAARDDTDLRELLARLPLSPRTEPSEAKASLDPLGGVETVSHYRVEERIGSGGMGVVYRAHDMRLGRPVALKLLPLNRHADPTATIRLTNEARAASALDHPNICTIYEIDETDDGRVFIAMAYYDGETLAETIERGPLSVEDALGYATAIGSGLSCAHRAGIVHRDVKPANVIVTKGGDVKILDFGLAKALGASSITAPGSTPGTVAYMSPEQTRGAALDARSDVWSLGVVLYEMLTGSRPFPGQTNDVVIHGIRNDDPAPPDAPEWLSRVVMRALQKDAGSRFASATEMLDALQSGASGALPADRVGTRRTPRVAILPLGAMRDTPDQDWFVDGMTDALITDLAGIGGIRVTSRASSMAYRGTTKTPAVIASELGVDYVVEGSVSRESDEVRISARLIDAARDEYLWAATYERPFRHVLGLQGEIARAVAAQVRVTLSHQEKARLTVVREVEPEAYELYLRGMYLIYRYTPDGMEKGFGYLHQAVERSPDEPLLVAGLAIAYGELWHMPSAPPDAVDKLRHFTELALELDENLADAQLALAMLRSYVDWDMRAGMRAIDRALELNPSMPSAHAHRGWFLFQAGMLDEALAEMREAKRLDPLNPLLLGFHAELLSLGARRYEEAEREANKALELAPNFPLALAVVGYCHAKQGRLEEAIAVHRRTAEVSPDYAYCVGQSYARAGMTEEALEVARRIESKPRVWDTFGLAQIYKSLGDTDGVFRWLEAAFERRNPFMPWIHCSGNFADFRDDPRFADLARRVGIELP